MQENTVSSNFLKHYEVIIIGAGPAGLKCAEVLAKRNKSVLLLEKNEKIGPKVCAGGITRKSFKFLGSPSEIISNDFDSIVFKTFKHKTRLFFGEKFLYTVDREKLGQWQLKKLTNSSVEVRIKAVVNEIFSNHIVVNGSEKIGYDFLVGADGSNSLVRKYLGLKTIFIGVAFQYLIPKKERFKDVEIFFNSRLFKSWYSWIFPHTDYISTGYGCFPKLMSMQKARANFEKWAQKMKIDLSRAKLEAHPINCDYKGYRFKNIFLAGDAAGLASGFTGEGIYQALASGEEIAKQIIKPSHKARLIKAVIRERNLHHFLLVLIFLSGPLRDFIFWIILRVTKNKTFSRILLRVLT